MYGGTSPGPSAPPPHPEAWHSSPSSHPQALPMHSQMQPLAHGQPPPQMIYQHGGQDWETADGTAEAGPSDPRPRRPGLRVHATGSSDESGSPTGSALEGKSEPASASAERKPKRSLSEASIERRKAQNRTAQKAFRERKERYVRDLEERCAMQAEEIRILRLELQRLSSSGVPATQPAYPPSTGAPQGYWASPPAAGPSSVTYAPAPAVSNYGFAAAAPPPGPDYTSVHPGGGRSHERYPGMQIPSVISAAYPHPSQHHHQHPQQQHTPSPYYLHHPHQQQRTPSDSHTPTPPQSAGGSNPSLSSASDHQPPTLPSYQARPPSGDPTHSRATSSRSGGPH